MHPPGGYPPHGHGGAPGYAQQPQAGYPQPQAGYRLLALGKPVDAATGQPPSWWQTGAVALATTSLVIGVGLVVAVGL